jgi:hypothetical protein
VKRCKDCSQRSIGIGQSLIVPKPDHPIPLRLDPIHSIRALLGMLTAIDLDDQLRLGTKEIRNIGTDRMLSAKPEAP